MAARRRRTSELDLWIAFFARLPWKVCLGLIPVAFVLFNALSRIPPPTPKTIQELGASYLPLVLRTVGMFCQWLVPGVLAVAALLSWQGRRQRGRPPGVTAHSPGDAPFVVPRVVSRQPVSASMAASAAPVTAPGCPACQRPMVRRTASRGTNIGKAFYGCSNYPQCRGTVGI